MCYTILTKEGDLMKTLSAITTFLGLVALICAIVARPLAIVTVLCFAVSIYGSWKEEQSVRASAKAMYHKRVIRTTQE